MKIHSVNQLSEQKEQVALSIFTNHIRIHPSLTNTKTKYIEDSIYTIRFLSTSLQVKEPTVFINYMKWFGQLAFHMHFNLDRIVEHFTVAKDTFAQLLAQPFFSLLIETWDEGVEKFKHSFHHASNERVQIDEFLQHLIDMNADKVYQYVLKQLEDGMSLQDVYLQILQPTLYQVENCGYNESLRLRKNTISPQQFNILSGNYIRYCFRVDKKNATQ
ncbi:MAG TPA: hypothetical protein PLR26_01410 [Bacilli bacterium]|nr:hypothetical protein [Bacilli bacterium]